MVLESWVALLPLIVVVPLLFVRTRQRDGDRMALLAQVALSVYLATLIGLTFFPLALPPYPGEPGLRIDPINLTPFATIGPALSRSLTSTAFRRLIGNVIALVPLGFLVPLVLRRLNSFIATVLVGAAVSVAIELGQFGAGLFVGYAYRSTDVDDVIVNVFGTVLGFVAFKLLGLGVQRGRVGRAHNMRNGQGNT